MTIRSKIETAFKIWNRHGLDGLRRRIRWNRVRAAQSEAYARWLSIHGSPTEAERGAMLRRIGEFASRPLISVLLPVYNVDEKWLRLCLDSVLGQIYPEWELCIADDCSPGPHIRRVLDEYAERDTRIKVVYRPRNGHISAASNTALELAKGEFAVLLDHDDELSPDALFWVANELNDHPKTAMIYSDEDLIDTRGVRSQPKFKPNFSRDLLYSLNLVTHLSAYKTELMRSIGGFRIGFEGSQDYDLALRVIETISEDEIRHIPRVLYHWRTVAGSVALSSDQKPYAHERARAAICEHFGRSGIAAVVPATHCDLHRVIYDLPSPPPAVSIICDVGDAAADAGRLLRGTDYPSFEIVMVSRTAASVGDARKVEIAVCPEPSLAARLNFGARRSSGEICVFVRADLVPLDSDWLTELTRFASRPEIGVVGGKVLSAHEAVVTAGLIIGAGTAAADAFAGFPRDSAGMIFRNLVVGNFSAVSAFCLAVKRADFDSAGGFDASSFPDALFAADFCLKIGQTGRRVVMTPYAELIERASLPDKAATDAEVARFRQQWPSQTKNDPFYNPNLSRLDGNFSIEI